MDDLSFERIRYALWAFGIALVVVVLVTPLVMRVARSIGAIDDPGDDRRVHKAPTPRLGGVGMFVGMIVATSLFIQLPRATVDAALRSEQLVVALVCAAFVCILGAIDDVRPLRWHSKLGGQIGIAVTAVMAPLLGPTTEHARQLVLAVNRVDLPFMSPVELPMAVGIGIAALWIVALMNMVNFIDGVDGLAAGVCAISAATFAVIAASYGRINIAVIAAATCGAAIGFLRFNFRRSGADIFMGDSGSMLLGFILAVISIQGVLKTTAAISLVIPMALLAVPILDTLFVVAKRVKYNVPVSNPDRWHLHHRLLNVGFSPRRTAVAFWVWTASMSAVALALRFVEYGNSANWRGQGLVVLVGVIATAMAASVMIAVRLEIIKTPRVRRRNAQIAAQRAANGTSDAPC